MTRKKRKLSPSPPAEISSQIPGKAYAGQQPQIFLNFLSTEQYLVCVPYLNSVLGQVCLEREHLPRVHVGVVSILESLLQLVQLIEQETEL